MRPVLLACVLLVVLGALAMGCASGGTGNVDGGRRDAPFSPFLDATARPDVPIVPIDAPVPPGTDTGVDAWTAPGTDAGPPPECTSAASCNDGNACNGVERCELGRCAPGTALACDDGIACTVDTCAGGSCSYAPNDAFCATGQTCTATGCTSTSTGGCNPVTQAGCGAGQACTIFTDGAGGYTTECAGPVGFGYQYDACFDETDCAAGHACIDPDGFGTACLHWCNVGTGAGCSGGFTCYEFSEPVVVAGVEYGVCA